jgi:superfamily I DNA/RNA helicase
MKPSIYQKAIYDAVDEGKVNIAISAVAGSGKTTTLIGIAERLTEVQRNRAVFCAFSKAIQMELEKRLPRGLQCKTIHALGMRGLADHLDVDNKNWLNDYKYKDIVDSVVGAADLPEALSDTVTPLILDAVRYAQCTLTDPKDGDAFHDMCSHFEIDDTWSRLAEMTAEVLRLGIKQAEHVISFSDMVWLPVVLNIPLKKYEFVMVDECQDLSNVQRALIRKIMKPGGRLIAVGDPHQAIFGFAGAGVDSFERVVETFNCKELPLSVCYRCPESHVRLAQNLVPHIEHREGAPEGEVKTIGYPAMFETVSSTARDMVLCRTNAPLIEAAFTFIGKGIPAIVKGRDIMAQILNLAKSALKLSGATWAEIDHYLGLYVERQIKSLKKKKNTEMQIAALQDRAEALRIILHRVRTTDQRISSVGGLSKYLDRIYSEDTNGAVTLCSIHKAKGLEADNVFILGPEKIPHPMATTQWAAAQEGNLHYVALTRAKKSLVMVPLPQRS